LRKGGLGKIVKPIFISRPISFEPLKKPLFGFSQFLANEDRFFPLKVLCYGHLSQSFLVHRISSWFALVWAIISHSKPRVNDVLTQKSTLKVNDVLTFSGKRCADIWHIAHSVIREYWDKEARKTGIRNNWNIGIMQY
jgi:hypothetical protein